MATIGVSKPYYAKYSVVGGQVSYSNGGIMGKIVHVGEDSIVIETSDDRVRMELTKWAVSTNNSNPPADKRAKKAKEDKEEPAKIEEGSDNETK